MVFVIGNKDAIRQMLNRGAVALTVRRGSFLVDNQVHGRRGRARCARQFRIGFRPEVAKLREPFALTFRARPMPGRQRSGFIQEEQLRVMAGVIRLRLLPLNSSRQIIQRVPWKCRRMCCCSSCRQPRLPVSVPRADVDTMELNGVTRFCLGIEPRAPDWPHTTTGYVRALSDAARPRVVHAGIDVELVRDDVGLKDVIQTLVLRNRHDLVLIAVVQLVLRADTACLRLARGRTDDDPRQLDPPAVCEATRKSAG